ncbi:IS66 family insertion sequence element accessory protein TnpB [Parapedobacter sp. ISTM3]|uniref:IS66 family insertion sequence element accessory protein TnpA n=1 Tax=Parapedobacter sp. ISTM3 TaxID=2800130 RepID=UPI00190476AD|nr:IS66 family insertion sequence element accessory protein TnpB [Parapedobacter sp. ISTM3]MBK1442701.1 IS66 family insertion sequence element accessory protein TnpB [Parapedobacter sp. ISTM3]
MKERRDYMFALVRQWRESGLTRKEFCLQHGITLSKFGYWISRWKEDQSAVNSGFIPMGSPGIAGHSVLSVIYPNGVRLEVPSADLGLLSRLIALV